jgi:hypothetical protein
LKCEWGADKDRRQLRSADKVQKQLKFPKSRLLGKEVDDVKLAFVNCELDFNGTIYESSVDFPDGWTKKYKEADDAKDYYFFGKEFALELGETGCVVEAGLEIEIVISEDDVGDEFLEYDDQDIAVEC